VRFYIFPFESVPKDSRIVLYGAGNVGRQLYLQMKKIKYCEVVLWVDDSIEYAANACVEKADTIANLNDNCYDMVIIAIEGEDITAINNSKEFLLNCGVPENKILHSANEYDFFSLYEADNASDCFEKLGSPFVETFIFPFESVPKNSRIILYGAGNVGKLYYSQIKKTGYCEIVHWVDKGMQITSRDYCIENPELITNLNSDNYDMVVIAVKKINMIHEIKSLLLSYGVPENKILRNIHEYMTFQPKGKELIAINQSNIDMQMFLYEQRAIEKAIVEYFYVAEPYLPEYFQKLIIAITEQISSENSIENNKWKKLFEEKTLDVISKQDLSIEVKLVLLYIMLLAKSFSPKLMKMLLTLVAEIKESSDLKYWLLIDMNLMYMYSVDHNDILYADFFVERKRLMQDYVSQLQLNCSAIQHAPTEKMKDICVLIPCFFEGVRSFIQPIVRLLKDKGYKIHVIALNMSFYCGRVHFVPIQHVIYNMFPERKLHLYFPEADEVHQIFNATIKDRQQDILNLIGKINPICILDASDDFAAVSYYYSQYYPTIYIPIRAVPASSFFHKIIFMNGTNITNKGYSLPFCEEDILWLPHFKEYVKPKQVFNREHYGINPDDIVAITIGKRLLGEISDDLAEQMCSLLRMEKTIKWLLVGCDGLPYIEAKHKDLVGKSIIFIEYEKDIPGLYGICDIYLNPKRVGGGTSIAWAMQQGLAIVSPLGAVDCLTHIGEENGLPAEADIAPHIELLSKNRELLRQKKEMFKSMAAKWDGNAYIDEFIRGMNNLIAIFSK